MRKWDEDEKRVFDMIKVLRGLDTEHVWAVQYFVFVTAILFHNAYEITKGISTDAGILKQSKFLADGMKQISDSICAGANVKDVLVGTCKVCSTKLDRNDMVLHCADHVDQVCKRHNLDFINDDVIEQIREIMLLEQEFVEHVAKS